MTRATPLMTIASLALLPAASAAAAATAPGVSIRDISQLPQPLPLPYSGKEDAGKQVARAKARARAENKKLLIELGGDWCPDCRVLAGIMQLPEIERFVRDHYVVVAVDIGRMDKNLDIPRHYGVSKLEGVPAVLVVDPKTDRLVNAGRLFALANARRMTPQALADWLAQWV